MSQFVWEEPVRGSYPGPEWLTISGLERLRRAVKGRAPKSPVEHLIGLQPIEAGVGTYTVSLPASPWLQNHFGFYTGAVGALAGDAALGGAVASGLEPWVGLATSQLCMNFLRPAGPWSERLAARGRLIHTTPTVGLSEVHVEDGAGRLLAHGTSRCFLQRFEPVDVDRSAIDDFVPQSYETPDPYLRPVEGAVLAPSDWEPMSGLEVLRGIQSGQIPISPIGLLFGGRLLEVEEGRIAHALPAHEWLCTGEKRVYGGATASMAHDAMTMAVLSLLPKGTSHATLDLTVNFVRPVAADGRELVARARIFHKGRTFAVAGVEIANADGKTVATASSSSIILAGRPFPDREDFVREFPSAATDDQG